MFSWVDYIIFTTTVLLYLGIGAFYALSGGRQKTVDEYLVADRQLGIIPVALSMTVSYLSSLSILGSSAEVHYHGVAFSFVIVGMVAGIICGAFCAIPLLHPLQITSLNEYLTRRYGSKALLLLSCLWQTMKLLIYACMVINATAVMLEVLTGLASWVHIVLMSAVTTFYTTLGGFKAVVWTDVLQTFIICTGLLTIIIRGVMLTGGLSEVFSAYDDGFRLQLNTNASPLIRQSVWSMFLSGLMSGYTTHHFSQPGVLRCCAVKSLHDAKRMALLSILFRVSLESLCCFCGVITFAYYSSRGCDPLAAGYIKDANQILPYFVMEVLSFPGLPGLFVACVCSGAFSTVSSCLNGIASVTWDDLLSDRLKQWSERRKAVLIKLLTFLFGALSLLLSLALTSIGGTIIQVSKLLGSSSDSPVAVVFLVGAMLPLVNMKSALSASLTIMVLAGWLSIGAMSHQTHQEVLPLTVMNCSTEIGVTAINIINNATVGFLYERGDNYSNDSTTTFSVPASDDSPGVSSIYLVSPYIMAELLIVVGILLSLVISVLPGCNTRGQARTPALYYPCIRRLTNRRGKDTMTYDTSGDYEKVERKDDGVNLELKQMDR